ncbi:hypothetical protein [Bradyrhizobium sp. SZCCHNS3052]|uniref:hypothetical protein n=1 Tax=Bradyrhizobium sp. SZCCHNS3052 TaxID=3057321 RepID=UPI002915DA75|nr:hypothetical protein [Bradyrhizobium sp. SZCCHNS3052]
MNWARTVDAIPLAAIALSGCITTSMQGYADRQLPAKPIGRMVAYVSGPGPLVTSIQTNIAEEARKRGVVADDALMLFPPTRTYTNAEVQQGLARDAIEGVLVISVGDSGVQQQYAGTILSGQYTGTSSSIGIVNTFGNTSTISMNGTSSGMVVATAAPSVRPRSRPGFLRQAPDETFGLEMVRSTPAAFCSSAMAQMLRAQ